MCYQHVLTQDPERLLEGEEPEEEHGAEPEPVEPEAEATVPA